MNKIPWTNIKDEYVRGIEVDGKRVYPTQRELAEKYGIDPSSIALHCKQEDWLSERQIFSSKVQAKSEQKQVDEISDKGVSFDLESFNIARKVQAKLSTELEKDLTAKESALLISAIKTNQAFAKEALGEFNTDSNQELKITIVGDNGNEGN